MLRNRGQWMHPALTFGTALWILLSWVGYNMFMRDQRTSGSWGCEMAWMYPTYKLIQSNRSDVSEYSLYLYREGRGVDRAQAAGYPVIFIPGNAGSYQQARSIGGACAALFYSHGASDRWKRPIDLFTVDFNEDLSAFHAPSLRLQAEYVAAAIPKVLAEYGHLPLNKRPTTVTLLGHSMGGVVARLADTLTPEGVIDTILTMSTPHMLPPAALEREMEQLYDTINDIHYDTGPLLVSVCGGSSDTLVVSDTCALPGSVVSPQSGFAVFSTGIPGVWTPVEHQAMVWCDQIRRRVARALLDVASAESRGERLAALKKWLLGPSKLRSHQLLGLEAVKVTVSSPSMSIVVQLPDATDDTLAEVPIQVRHCLREGDCASGNYDLHVIPWLANSEDPFPEKGKGSRAADAAFVVDVHGLTPGEGWLEVDLPVGGMIRSAGPFENKEAIGRVTFDNTPSTHVVLNFPTSFLSSMAAWRLTVQTRDCVGTVPTALFRARPARALLGSTFESRAYPLANGSLTVHSHIGGAPFLDSEASHNGHILHVFQQPGCSVKTVSLHLDTGATISKAMLRLRAAIPAWCVGWIAVVQVLQLHQLIVKGRFPSVQDTLERYGYQLTWVGSVVSMAALASQTLAQNMGCPTPHLFLGHAELRLLPVNILTAWWCLGTVAVLSIAVQGALRLSVTVYCVIQPKRQNAEHVSISWIMGSRLALAALLLWSVATIFPFRLGLVILVIVLFALLVDTTVDERNTSHSAFWQSCLLLMASILPLCLPSVVVWGKNIWSHRQHAFSSDHALLPMLPALLMVFLCSLDRPLPSDRRALRLAQVSAAAVAVLAFGFGPYRPWVLLPAVNFAFTVCGALMLLNRA